LIGQGLKVNSGLQRLYLVRLFGYCLFLWGRCRERAGRGSAALTRVLQGGNRIGDAGARGLGEGLKVNSGLQRLYLVRLFGYCLFLWGRCRERAGRGWAALTRVLQGGNGIGDAGARGLGEVLKVNSSLQRLWLVRLFLLLFVFVGAMQGEGGEGVGCTHACAAGGKSNRRRWGCRAGRGAESQQQPAEALACKAFFVIVCFCGGDAGSGRGGGRLH